MTIFTCGPLKELHVKLYFCMQTFRWFAYRNAHSFFSPPLSFPPHYFKIFILIPSLSLTSSSLPYFLISSSLSLSLLSSLSQQRARLSKWQVTVGGGGGSGRRKRSATPPLGVTAQRIHRLDLRSGGGAWRRAIRSTPHSDGDARSTPDLGNSNGGGSEQRRRGGLWRRLGAAAAEAMVWRDYGDVTSAGAASSWIRRLSSLSLIFFDPDGQRSLGGGSVSRGSGRLAMAMTEAMATAAGLEFFLVEFYFFSHFFFFACNRLKRIFAYGCAGRMEKLRFSQTLSRIRLEQPHATISFVRM